MQPLVWTSKNLWHLVRALADLRQSVSRTVVAELLRSLNYNLQTNAKSKEGGTHPDRNAKLKHINTQVKSLQVGGEPVIRSTPRRRNWSATAKTTVASGGQRASPIRSRVTA